MLETVTCAVDAPVPIRVTAARRSPRADAAEPWVYFVHPIKGDFYFPMFEGEDVEDTIVFDARSAQLARNLAILLGSSWSDIWDDFEAEVAYLLNLQVTAGKTFLAQVMPWTERVCLHRRRRMDTLPTDPGEILRWNIAGVDVHAGRN